MRGRVLLALVCVLGVRAIAQDQDEPLARASAADPWTLKFEPSVWYVALNGTARFPGSVGAGNGDSFELADLNLDSPRLTPAAELHVQRGDWRIRASGLWFDTEGRESTVTTPGQIGAADFADTDILESEFELLTFGADAGYAFHRYRSKVGQVPVDSTVWAIAGVRAIGVDVATDVFLNDVVAPVGRAEADALHAHPVVGVRWDLQFTDQFAIDATTSIGGLSMGDTESWSSDILVGFQWNPTQNLGVQLGYRQLLMGIETDDAPSEFAWNGGLAGVYAGATLRF